MRTKTDHEIERGENVCTKKKALALHLKYGKHAVFEQLEDVVYYDYIIVNCKFKMVYNMAF